MELSLPDRPQTAMTLPLQLSGIVNPAAQTTLVSQRLTFAYIIDSLTVSFPIGCDHLVQVTPLLSLDPSVSIVAVPPGNYLLSYCSPTVYILGDDATFQFPMNLQVDQRGTYLKCHLKNLDAFIHRVTIVFALRELMEENP